MFAEVEVDLRGVHLDRGRLFNDRKARITEIDHGKVTATITEDALQGVARARDDGRRATVTVVGLNVVTPKVSNGRLR